MKLAAIDIGSNAVRLLVSEVIPAQGGYDYKKVEFVRFPLRLGADVFRLRRVSAPTEERFVKLMHAYRLLIDLYEVADYRAYATSALREAENGAEIARRIYYQQGLKIQVIDGDREAAVLQLAIQKHLRQGNILHVDVGGGSTELNLYTDGVLIGSHSFAYGSVRSIEQGSQAAAGQASAALFEEMTEWIRERVSKMTGQVRTIGTGGNINKIYELAGRKKDDALLRRKELEKTVAYIRGFSMTDRLFTLKLNPDRADVILPAAEIYLNAMRIAGAKEMIVPGVGLKEGILLELHQEWLRNHEAGL